MSAQSLKGIAFALGLNFGADFLDQETGKSALPDLSVRSGISNFKFYIPDLTELDIGSPHKK